MRFLVVGAGSWGTAFTRVLLDREHDVVLACRTPEQAETIASAGWNPRYLQSVDLSAAEAVPLADAPGDVDVVVVAVPSRAFVEVVDRLPGDAPVLSLVKGLDPETGERLSTRVRGRSVAVLSGPNIAEEIAAGLPTAAVIASEDGLLAGELQHALSSSLFRAYVNPDVVGRGAVCGGEERDRARRRRRRRPPARRQREGVAARRGLAEMTRLGEAAGARPETFAGLAGIGDLVVTCCSATARNRHAGELIAQGLTPEQAVAEIGQTVEGLTTAPILRDLSHRLGVELPVTEGVCAVLSGQSITELAAGLMGREPNGGDEPRLASLPGHDQPLLFLHLGVGHRGPSRQDGRPDLRLRPRRRPRRRPQRAASPARR